MALLCEEDEKRDVDKRHKKNNRFKKSQAPRKNYLKKKGKTGTQKGQRKKKGQFNYHKN